MEFSIENATRYLVVAGSHSYGTATESSDFDLRGWAIPPREYFLSFDKKFEQNDTAYKFKDYPSSFAGALTGYCARNNIRTPAPDEEIDHCIYDIRKFFSLCAACNPNVLEQLFVRPNEVLMCGTLSTRVLNNRDLFLSARAKHTFTGYAVAQMKRINTHRHWLLHPQDHKPTREEFGLPETSLIPADKRSAAEKLVDDQVREWLFQDMTEESIGKTQLAEMHGKLGEFIARILYEKDLVVKYLDEKELLMSARLVAMRKLGMSENYMSVLQSEKVYRSALTEWTQYQTWVKTRNPARAVLEAKFGYDTKHASQLVRLLNSGRQLLTQGKLDVYQDNVQLLKDIRGGAWTYEQLIKFMEEIDKELTDIYDNKKYVVPHKPNMVALSKLCYDILAERGW